MHAVCMETLVPHTLILPIVSIVVPIFGLTSFILTLPKDNPQKELQWRL